MTEPRPTVLILTTTFPASAGDGTPSFVLDLASRMADDFEIHVLAPRVPDAPSREMIDGISVERFAYFPRRWERVAYGATLANLRAQPWRACEFMCLIIRFWWCAWRGASGIRPEVLHAHWLLPAGLVAACLRSRGGVIVTVHGVDVHALRVAPVDAMRRFALSRADVVATVSEDLRGIVRGLDGGVALRTVPMGTDVQDVVAHTTPRDAVPGRVGFVGRLAEKKGVDVLIRALSMTLGLSLVIAGDGPERPVLERLARDLGLGDRVEFRGHSARAEVFELLRTCEVLAVPSVVASDGDREGTPVVVAEAVAATVPVIASRLGGIAEHLDATTAWLVEPGDVEALAAALREAHEQPDLRASRAETAKLVVSPLLSIDVTAASYGDMYREVIER